MCGTVSNAGISLMDSQQFLESKPVVIAITSLILFSVLSFSIETLPDLSKDTLNFFHYAEIAVVSVFSLEYLFRLYAAEKRWWFVFSFYGIVDLLAILPFYMSTGLDLRSLRLLRILRLARLLKLVRYGAAIKRFVLALTIAKEELIIYFIATLVMLYLTSVGIYYFEHAVQPEKYRSIFDCLWWAVSTLTTVGYGDIYPITTGGRLFTFGILILGLGLIAVPTGIISSALSEALRRSTDHIDD